MTDFEREDMELAEMMGEHFIDATKGEETVTMTDFEPEPVKPDKKPHVMDIPVEAQWQPAKPAKTAMDRIKDTAKDCMVFGTASMILCYWQQTEKLDYTTAWYALLICVGMVFFSIGRHWERK
jgi:hypothetical protein